MKSTPFFPFAEAAGLATKANCLASAVRTNQRTYRTNADNIRRWEKVFSLPFALLMSGSFLLLAIADCFLLGEMYRQLSQLICGDADELRWTIAIALNTIVGICSHEISRTIRTGAFFDWEVMEFDNSSTPYEINYSRVLNARAQRRYGLVAMLGVLAIMVTLILYLRSVLTGGPGAAAYPLDAGTIIIGLGFLVFEIAAGCYFLYLLEYLTWITFRLSLHQRVRSGIKQVSKMDRAIHELWVHLPPSTMLTADLHDALYRFLFRRQDLNYCDLPENRESMYPLIVADPKISAHTKLN